ncbi:MAG: 50S ribosomal protein L30 [Deltaproteobacteria bacterium]|nr:50S ribosomal protein L30 [Deltaproteobacteria bacterium]MCB9787351.1 50S ribosomal protein L30 [Deltaproteobacteria bacterium]
MSGKVRLTLVRSYDKASERQQRVLWGLGLRRINQVREHADDPAIRGMITKVAHLVTVETV